MLSEYSYNEFKLTCIVSTKCNSKCYIMRYYYCKTYYLSMYHESVSCKWKLSLLITRVNHFRKNKSISYVTMDAMTLTAFSN